MYELRIDGQKPLKVARFTGVEALGELFQFEITVVSDDGDIDLRSLIGQPAQLAMGEGPGSRLVSGIVRRAQHGEEGKLSTSYQITIVPPHFKMTLRRNQRIFQEKTTAEVVEQVIKGAGVAVRLSLQGSYDPREYCVQYRETDWDFVCRLLEDDGITSFFQSTEDGCTLVLTDAPTGFEPIPESAEVRFIPPAEGMVSGDHVSRLRLSEEMRAGKVTLRDYNFKKPGLRIEGKHEASLDAELELYDYPADHDSPPGTEARAKNRQLAQETQRRTIEARGNCHRLAPGLTFSLVEHPVDGHNQSYLVTRAYTTGQDPQVFGSFEGDRFVVEFEGIPEKVRHVPALVTPRPRIHGVQTAIVVGPSGEEIHVDQHARIKVQFHWDRLGEKNDASSCWMRVAQPWAGSAFGTVFIPRVGHEVLVSFLEGDPDRPMVTGSVYHGANVPPYALPQEKTKTTIKTNSSPHGGGYNELRFEDKKGSEEVFLRAEKDLVAEIQNDRTQHVGNNDATAVDANRTLKVGQNDTETVVIDKTVQTGANHTEIVGANLLVTVGANIGISGSGGGTFTLSGSLEERVDENVDSHIGKKKTESVGESSTEKVAADKSTKVGGDYSLGVDKDATVAVKGNADEEVEKKKTVTVGESYTLEVGDAKVTIQKNGDIVIEGKSIKILGSGPVQIEGSKLQVKSDGSVDVKASGAVKVKGSSVDMN